MSELFTFAALGSLVSLTALETVLGIDNIIFLTILVGKMPKEQQTLGRRLGLILALGMRIVLLLTLSTLASYKTELFKAFGHPISARDLVLMIGGGFLIFKSTWEMYGDLEGGDDEEEEPASEEERARKARSAFVLSLLQIMVMDIVFSLDSVITAVGLAPAVPVMVTAMVLSMCIMLAFAKAIGDFVESHPSMKILALSFLIMIGTLLVAEGGGQTINKGYVYFAMAFSVSVELLNLKLRKKRTNEEEEAPKSALLAMSEEELDAQIKEQSKVLADLKKARSAKLGKAIATAVGRAFV